MSQAKTTDTTSRRRFLAGAAVAVVVPTGAAAAPVAADAALVEAAAEVVRLDEALEAFLDANDCDCERPEWQAKEDRRSCHLDTLMTVPAAGMVGLLAKARTLQTEGVKDSSHRMQGIALSLADDLTGGLLS
ncbi:hypothetical protein [Bradyrhizobium sp. USDA 4508]